MRRAALVVVLLAGCGEAPSPAAVAGGEDVATVVDGAATPDLAPAACEDGATCDDGDPCTQSDRCTAGECAGTAYVCEDGDDLECTVARCDGEGGCATAVLAGAWCLIGGACVPDGAPSPNDPCKACVTPVSATSWSSSDGAACDDGKSCTEGDTCLGGACRGTKEACDDGNPCTTNGCKEGTGCVHAALQGACEDGDFCSVGDTCTNLVCVPGPKTLDCDDGAACTEDVCAAGGGCHHIPHSGVCDDGDPCTVGDACIQGECTPGSQKLGCDDQNPCTSDLCLAGKGCAHVPNLAPCEDDDPCSTGDTCSNGACTTGFFTKDCSDGDPCTNDVCEPLKGCNHFPAAGACEDGNPCTVGETCQSGYCKGTTLASCDDGNECTEDVCDAKVAGGCVHKNAKGSCETGDACVLGTCKAGQCEASLKGCDDGNSCTDDACAAGGCTHALKGSADCQIAIVITSPPRGATLTGNPAVVVKGKVTSPAAPVASATLNGKDLTLDAAGNFAVTLAASHGMNLLAVEAADALGGTDRGAQSFYFSTKWQPSSPSDPKGSAMPKALYLYLGPEAIDDGDHAPTDADDLATIFELIIQGFDIKALVPNPLVSNGSYDVFAKNIGYQPAKVSLVAIAGGLHLHASIAKFHTDVQANGKCLLCPNVSGSIDVSQIVIDADLLIKSVNGAIQVTMAATNVVLVNPDVDVDGIIGSLFDFLVDFIVDQFAPTIEKAFESQLGSLVPGTLAKALQSLAFNSSFDIGPFFDGGKKVSVTLATTFEHTFWSEDGGTLRMAASATAEKSVSHPVLGVMRRDACLGGAAESLALSMESPLQLGLGDDLVNAILFAAWSGGAFKFPLPPSALAGQDLSKYGITDATFDIDFRLPPVITGCTPSEELVMQIGDIQVHAKLTLAGKPLELDVFASAEAFIEIAADDKGLGLEITALDKIVTDIVIQSEGFASAEKLVSGLLGDALVPKLFEALTGGALASFPLPDVDLGGLVPGIPAGTKIAIDPYKVDRVLGWTVVSGGIK